MIDRNPNGELMRNSMMVSISEVDIDLFLSRFWVGYVNINFYNNINQHNIINMYRLPAFGCAFFYVTSVLSERSEGDLGGGVGSGTAAIAPRAQHRPECP